MLKKARTVRPKKIKIPKTRCTSGEYLIHIQISIFIYISRESHPKVPKKFKTKRYVIGWQRVNRKRKYNYLRKEHSRSQNESFGQKSSDELFRRTSSCQLNEGFRGCPVVVNHWTNRCWLSRSNLFLSPKVAHQYLLCISMIFQFFLDVLNNGTCTCIIKRYTQPQSKYNSPWWFVCKMCHVFC